MSAKPVIAYLNMLSLSTTIITDPGTAVGFDIDDLADMKPWMPWKADTTVEPIHIDIDCGAGTEQDADYISFIGSNMKTNAATVRVLADTVFPPVAEVLPAVPVATDDVAYGGMAAPGVKRYWRITLGHASAFPAAPFIGHLQMGIKTTLPSFLTPEFGPFFTGVEVAGTRSNHGHYLGAQLRGKTHRGVITFGETGAPRADFTSSLNAFIDNHAHLRKPFIFQLDSSDSDFAKAFFVRLIDDEDVGRFSVGDAWNSLTFDLPVREAYSERAA